MKLSRESPWLPRVITGVMFDGRLVSPRVVLPWALGEKRDINGVQHTRLLELIRVPGHALHRHAYDRVSLHAWRVLHVSRTYESTTWYVYTVDYIINVVTALRLFAPRDEPRREPANIPAGDKHWRCDVRVCVRVCTYFCRLFSRFLAFETVS